jgi:hypothetical protein
MPDLVVILLCLAAAGISLNLFRMDLFRTLNRQNETPIGIISFKYRAAQRRPIDRVIWDRLRTESPVYNGDTIRTAELSEATLTFAGGETLDLTENTLIHITVTQNETAIKLDSGILNASAGSSSGMVLFSGDSRITLDSGSVVNAGTGETGLTLRVMEGNARVDNPGGRAAGGEGQAGGRIAAGDALTLGAAEQSVPLITVTRPLPNARFYNSTERASLEIPFTFNKVNFQGPVRLDIGADRSFKRLVAERTVNGNEESVALPPGVYFWRAYFPEAGSAKAARGKLSIIDAPPPVPVRPAAETVFRYRSKNPALRFQWSVPGNVSSSILEVADNPEMRNPRIQTQVRGTALQSTELGAGRWYWRVSPVFFREYSGPPSAVSAFIIEQANVLSAPLLVSPREGELVNTAAVRSPVCFSWRTQEEAVSYTVLISRNQNLSNPVFTGRVKGSYYNYSPAAGNALRPGVYYWGVRFTDSEGNESPASVSRSFTALEQEVIQRTIFPPDGYTVTASLLPDIRFTWKVNLPWATRIEIAPDPDFSRILVNEAVSGESFQGRPLPEGSYWWRISSAVGNGNVLQSSAKRFNAVSALPEVRPEYPARNGIVVVQPGEETVFRWRQVSGAEYYRFRLYRTGVSDPVFERANVEQTSLSIALSQEGPYTWTVQSFAGETRQSSRRTGLLSTSPFTVRIVKPASLDYPPAGYTYPGLRAVRNPDAARWSSADRPARFRFILSRNRDLSSPVTEIAFPSGTVQFPKLSPGTYYWTIEAETGEGFDISAEPSWFTVLPVPSLPAAGNRLPSAGFLIGADYLTENSAIRFSWDPVPEASRYVLRIFRAGAEGNPSGAALFSALTENNFYEFEELSVLDNGPFIWQVEAQNADAEGFVEQSGTPINSAFTVDIPLPGGVRVLTGELYGIESDDRRKRGRQTP